MILESIIRLIMFLVYWIIDLLAYLPELPAGIITPVSTFIGYFAHAVPLIRYFVPVGLLITLATIAFTLENIGWIYDIYKFIVKKIPFIGVE